MKLKKKYKFDNKRQIWRILPANSGKLVIEEREPEKKQVYFHCIDLDSGKNLLSNFQFDDNFWVGIEAVKDDTIFFHKFAKPDMPKHKGIFAFDINSKKIFWENPDLIFQFIYQDKIYAYVDMFEGRKYFSLDPVNGKVLEEFNENVKLINDLRDKSKSDEHGRDYFFPEVFEDNSLTDQNTIEFIHNLRNTFVISGKIEFIINKDLLLLSFHEANSKGSLNNIFKAIDLSTGKFILEEVINKETKLFYTDSFFVKGDTLFLLFGKNRLVVYNILN